MTIRATCKCGKQVQTKDENAGKRMKCPGCGGVVTMPAAGAAVPKPAPAANKPAPAVEKPATVSFSCDCGKQLHAKAEMAGKRTKCPGCGTILTVPHAESPPTEDFDASPEPEVRTTRSPKPAVKPPVLDDEEDEPQGEELPARRAKKPAAVEDEDAERDEDDEEEKPARKRRKSKAPVLIGVIVTLLVLAGGGFAGWYFLFREPEKPTKPEVAKGPPGGGQGSQRGQPNIVEQPAVEPGDGSAILDLVPRDALGFVSIRVGDWWNSDFGKKAQQQIAQAQPGGVELMEQALGLSPGDIERLVIVFPDANMQAPKVWALISTSKAYDPKKLLTAGGPPLQKKEHNGKPYYEQNAGPQSQALHFINDHLLLGGMAEGVKGYLGRSEKPKADGPLSGALALAGQKHHIVVGANVPPGMLPALGQQAGPQLKPFEPLLELQSATITASVGDDLQLDIHLNFADEAKAKNAEQAVRAALTFGQLRLAGAKQDPNANADLLPLLNTAADLLPKIVVEQKAVEVAVAVKTEGGTLAKALSEGMPKVQAAGKRTQIANNLRQLGLAMHSVAATYGGNMPPAAIYGKDGKSLLSWRVAILPYIEQDTLYRQFKLDEPWDGPNNIKLLDKMPKLYAPVINKPKDANTTFLQVFTGAKAPFFDKPDGSPPFGAKGPHLPRTFTDGTSNTILIVEAGEAVPWTKPDDIPYDPAKPLPMLGGDNGGDGFYVALADGSVRFVKRTVSDMTLRAAITPAGGEALGKDW